MAKKKSVEDAAREAHEKASAVLGVARGTGFEEVAAESEKAARKVVEMVAEEKGPGDEVEDAEVKE